MPRKPRFNRETLISTAAQLADQHGFYSLTLAMLAAELRIRTPSLYNHIDGLYGLHRALALHGVEQLTQAITQAVLGKSGAPAVTMLAQTYRNYIKQHPGVYAATVLVPQLIEPGDDLEVATAALVHVVSTIIASLTPLADPDLIHAVRGLRSLVHGFATLENSGGFGLPVDVETSFQQLVQLYIKGIS